MERDDAGQLGVEKRIVAARFPWRYGLLVRRRRRHIKAAGLIAQRGKIPSIVQS
jgi:hypothetical protein